MIHKRTPYILTDGEKYLVFESEQNACEFLGVKKSVVSSCYRSGSKCKGYSIIKGQSEETTYMDKRLFKIWSSMHERCEYAKHPHYKDYGGRGIYVCDEWKEYLPFAKWSIANGYKDDLTIDRVNNEKGYCPENCRWVTMKEQANNKRTNHIVEINGKSMTLSQCSEKYKIPKSTLRWRDQHDRDLISGAKMFEGENTCG